MLCYVSVVLPGLSVQLFTDQLALPVLIFLADDSEQEQESAGVGPTSSSVQSKHSLSVVECAASALVRTYNTALCLSKT